MLSRPYIVRNPCCAERYKIYAAKLIEILFSFQLEAARQGSHWCQHNQRAIVRNVTNFYDIQNDTIDEIDEVFSIEVHSHFSLALTLSITMDLLDLVLFFSFIDGARIFKSTDDGSLYRLFFHSIIHTPFRN